MTKAKSAAHVCKEIGNPKLTLNRGYGYWYFVYDDVAKNVFEDRSVAVCYLRQMSLEQWIEEGKSFLADLAAK